MQITLSDSARAKLRELLSARGGTPSVRLGLRSGGCKGFEQFIELSPTIAPEDQTIDDAGLLLVVDKKSAILLDNLTLDWQSSLTVKRFVFTFPDKKAACSCGNSFSV